MHAALGKKRTVICFLLPAVLVYAISVILPIFWSGYYSLFDWNGIGEKIFVGIGNFQELIGDQETLVLRLENNCLHVFSGSIAGWWWIVAGAAFDKDCGGKKNFSDTVLHSGYYFFGGALSDV